MWWINIMQFFFKTLTGKTITVDISEADTVFDAKKKVAQRENMQARDIHLVVGGSVPNKNENFISAWRQKGQPGTIHILLSLSTIRTPQQAAFVLAQADRNRTENNAFRMFPRDCLIQIIAHMSEHLPENKAIAMAKTVFDTQNDLFLKVKNESKLETMAHKDLWLKFIYQLFINLEAKIKTDASLERTGHYSFLQTILRAIRKGEYAALAGDPENVGAIPLAIFETAISPYIEKTPYFLKPNDNIKPFLKQIEDELSKNSLEPFQSLIESMNDKEDKSSSHKVCCIM